MGPLISLLRNFKEHTLLLTGKKHTGIYYDKLG
jgi:hypothetical protein